MKTPSLLMNKRHEHKPENWDYGDHLLHGQFILMAGDGTPGHQSHYWEQRRAYFTRYVRCPGTGAVAP